MSQRNHSAGRRLSVMTVDQAVAGASNLLMSLLAAHVLGLATFGLFGIVFLVYVVTQGVSRALVAEPLLVRPADVDRRAGDAVATGVVLGLGLGAVVLLAGLSARVWDVRLGNALVVLAVCLPFLVLQDLGRYLGFATRRPWFALTLDLAWFVLMVGAVALLFVEDLRTLGWFMVAWAGTGAVSGLLVLLRYPLRRLDLRLTWLREGWGFSWRYLASYTSGQLGTLVGSAAVGVVAGPAALGAIRGALVLVRPFMTFQLAAIAFGVADVARVGPDRHGLRWHATRISGLTVAVGVVNTAVMLLLPTRLGELVLGNAWHAARPLLLAVGLQIVLVGATSGVRAALLGSGAVGTVLRLDVPAMACLVALMVAGAAVDGAVGAAWATALGQLVVTGVWLVAFRSHLGARRSRPLPALPLAGVEREVPR